MKTKLEKLNYKNSGRDSSNAGKSSKDLQAKQEVVFGPIEKN